MTIYENLLKTWCEKLLSLQIKDIDDKGIKGGIMCPSCSRIHGRCFDAIYPFMYMAETDSRYLEAAKELFEWADYVVSRQDGSFVNDTNSCWKGTTVFTVIQLVEALKYHGHLLDKETYQVWKERILKAAEFLYAFDDLSKRNVNYKITNSVAMYYCGELYNDDKYTKKAKQLAYEAIDHISESGILFGEGRPIKGYSEKGCRPVDIGYNMEESLPALALYGYLASDDIITEYAQKALAYQLKFMLDDGGIDNSFGTRNFKWSYWGSRTSDGCALGYLLLAKNNPVFGVAALKNVNLLNECTYDGLLHGGPHYKQIGEPPCVHHTFAHAKVLTAILDHGLEDIKGFGELPRKSLVGLEYFKDVDTYQVGFNNYTATITGYDWEYLKGGHASGGAMTMLWSSKLGVIISASMSEYTMKEPNNMQLPKFKNHECLTPRIEYNQEDGLYNNLYDYCSKLSPDNSNDCYSITVKGNLKNIDLEKINTIESMYNINYKFKEDKVNIMATFDNKAKYILPIICEKLEDIIIEDNNIILQKNEDKVIINIIKGKLKVPNYKELIYNLVPGFLAKKVEILPINNEIEYEIIF